MSDLQRPTYHFLPPSHWMNDPNGLIQWGGRYHMFYQHNPFAASHGQIHWGHASSADLLRWEHEPIALAPGPGGPDADGCWSGCAVDDGGVPTLIYSGHVRGEFERACLATSADAGLRQWRKHPGNPVLAGPPPGLDLLATRDHAVWREGARWYMLMGAGLRDRGGAALLYRSPDLRSWEYRGPLLAAADAPIPLGWTGTLWECPDLFPLGGRHAMLLSAWDVEPQMSVAMVGDYRAERFVPAQAQKLDYGDTHFYAPQSFRDGRGRRIVFGWAMEGRSVAAQLAAGWSGVMSLPRELGLDAQGRLTIRPIAEAATLRGRRHDCAGLAAPAGAAVALEGLAGAALEVELELALEPGCGVGLALRRSPDGAEQTTLGYHAGRRELWVDRSRASRDPDAASTPHVAPLELDAGEPLRLRVFLDGSMLEVFANDRAAITSRIYPTRPDSLGLALSAEGAPARPARLDVWEIAGIW